MRNCNIMMIRFEINIDAAKRAGLKISSRVLKLAQIFKEEENQQAE